MRSRGSRWLPAGIHIAGLLLFVGGAQAAPTVAQKCQSGKNIAAGKYADCGQKAEAKFALSLDGAKRTLDRARCEGKLQAAWAALEAKAVAQGGSCPSVGDVTPVQATLDLQADTLAIALAGTGDPAPPQARRLKTRQTNCYGVAFPHPLVPCAGTGQDGEYQRGVALSYRDPGVGTVEDTRTGLTWEKQSWDSSVNDHNLVYTWDGALAKIAALNAAAFAGFDDWRLPNRTELDSLVSSAAAAPAVDPSFNVSCMPGCTVVTCSCTSSDRYWTSTTFEPVPAYAWEVDFAFGETRVESKTQPLHARAVRGGS